MSPAQQRGRESCGSVEVRDSLPLSGAGKVLKIELRAPYWIDQQRRVG